MAEILKIGENFSEECLVARAVDILKHSGVIAYPTETFYGLGADGFNEKAIQKIFTVKGRDFNNPISLIVGQPDDIIPLVREIPEAAKKLMSAFWPGALTIVFFASEQVSPWLTAGSGKIGLRLSSHPLARQIARQLGSPLTATSANRSGAPECQEASSVMEQVGHLLDAVVDGGITLGVSPSTVIDVTCDPPVVLREGAITRDAIGKCVLF